MKELFYETISYHELINGDLAPKTVDTSNITEYFNSEGVYCQEMILAKYDKDDFEFIEEIRISSAHPLAESYFDAEEPHFPKKAQDNLKSKILQHLDIQTVNLENKLIYKSENGVQLVGMIIDADWDEVEKNRLKYCYFNRLLQEMEKKHIGIIKQINITQSEDQLKSSIIKIQRDLHGNLNEITNEFNLKSSDLEIKVKKVYTDKDCIILVYKSMLEILDYISTTFYDFIDQKKDIPYYSKLFNQNDVVTKTEKILKQLDEIEIEERLQLLIEDELRKILDFDISKRITYLEFDEFKRFLYHFSKFLEKHKHETFGQTDLIHFLISISFKKQIFFEYIIHQLQSTLIKSDGFEERNEFLMTKKKEYLQLKLSSIKPFNADETPLVLDLLQWVNLELKHVKRETQTRIPESQKLVNEKIVTTLSSKKLGAYYLVSKDFGIFKPESMIQFSEWIHETHKNETDHSYTPDSIRNNFYKIESKSREMLRDFAFYILDVTNQNKE
ncbi:hypothetical protein CW751_14570 [Brumimicrobium salinarum]|uniref:Uncharacterized protein n=2 Tax=Brumimicrobium salinarum TaxID=2058658 RepID=A0A2I0QZ15_9FLAO|nr:hypothetical protein CW751_14570 [Brumimicrobium salinarum]